jgi:hypothetical protein
MERVVDFLFGIGEFDTPWLIIGIAVAFCVSCIVSKKFRSKFF